MKIIIRYDHPKSITNKSCIKESSNLLKIIKNLKGTFWVSKIMARIIALLLGILKGHILISNTKPYDLKGHQ